MVNAPDDVWVERAGLLQKTPVTFEDDEHVKFVINRIASADGRRCDEAQPLCDCILNRPGAIFNGSRVAATAKGIAVDHNILNIRKFRPDAVEPEDLMALGTFDQRMLEFMEAIVLGRMNVVIAGGTGSGKTTLLNACSSFIPDNQRIVTIEDAPELRLQKPHVVRKTARRPNIEGEGEITIRQLVIHALRERPDRIVVGECRGGEAFDMIQAMMTGHEGSLTTVHSSNAREATTRLRSMIQQTGTEMRSEQIMELIASAIDFIVFVNRFDIDGSRQDHRDRGGPGHAGRRHHDWHHHALRTDWLLRGRQGARRVHAHGRAHHPGAPREALRARRIRRRRLLVPSMSGQITPRPSFPRCRRSLWE